MSGDRVCVCVSRVLLVVMCAERLCVQVWCVQSGYVCRVVMWGRQGSECE